MMSDENESCDGSVGVFEHQRRDVSSNEDVV